LAEIYTLYNTRHSQNTDIRVHGGIRTANPSKRPAETPRLRLRTDIFTTNIKPASTHRIYSCKLNLVKRIHTDINLTFSEVNKANVFQISTQELITLYSTEHMLASLTFKILPVTLGNTTFNIKISCMVITLHLRLLYGYQKK
jgi:hypothetical protein